MEVSEVSTEAGDSEGGGVVGFGGVRTGGFGRERRAECLNAHGGKAQVTAAGSSFRTARHYAVEGSPGAPGRGLGMGCAPMPSWATFGENWRAGLAV